MGLLDDKVIIITGATSGIGRATAIAAAEQGATVVAASRREDRGAEVVEAITGAGGNATFVATDVTKEADIKALVERTMNDHGRLDGAFNCAGVLGMLAPLDAWTDEAWEQLMDVNLRSVLWGLRHQVPAMKESGGGSIVNCSSITGIIVPPYLGAYGVSRLGVCGLTKAAAADYAADGIRCNAVLPGPIETEVLKDTPDPQGILEQFGARTLFGRYAQPEEVARPVCFLLSDWASFITAQYLIVDGGLLSK